MRGRHELYLMCDDVRATLDELRAKGVEPAGEVSDQGWGVLAHVEVPGMGRLGLYEPRHPSPLLPSPGRRRARAAWP